MQLLDITVPFTTAKLLVLFYLSFQIYVLCNMVTAAGPMTSQLKGH